jgi:hypothetical protein
MSRDNSLKAIRDTDQDVIAEYLVEVLTERHCGHYVNGRLIVEFHITAEKHRTIRRVSVDIDTGIETFAALAIVGSEGFYVLANGHESEILKRMEEDHRKLTAELAAIEAEKNKPLNLVSFGR